VVRNRKAERRSNIPASCLQHQRQTRRVPLCGALLEFLIYSEARTTQLGTSVTESKHMFTIPESYSRFSLELA